MTWTREQVRHAGEFVRQGRTPAATVYDSIGSDFPLALAPGWLNLGLWEGNGSDPSEAPVAVRRLVETMAADLPRGGEVLDVGNGLAAQDSVIASVAEPSRLVAVNITTSQLIAGRSALAEAKAHGVRADATRLPFVAESFDGVISVEAAFHFPSRGAFFAEAGRVLRPGGVLTMSDVPVMRYPRTPRELIAGIAQLRLWGLHRGSAATPEQIVASVEAAGFTGVRTRLCADQVIDPALRFVRARFPSVESDLTPLQRRAVRFLINQVEVLRERGLLEYLLLAATWPGEERS
jgi:SAM-dependent methyltransferase